MVEGVGVRDGDVAEASRERDGDEAVVAIEAGGDGGLVEGDAPGWVVAEIEDQSLRRGRVEGQAGWRGAGGGVGGGWLVGIGFGV